MTLVDQGVSYDKPNFDVDHEFELELGDPDVVRVSSGSLKGPTDEALDEDAIARFASVHGHGSAGEADASHGRWTMVYDEGIDVYVGGRSYFSFFRYSKRSVQSRPDKVEDFKWHCGETLSGWFHPQAGGEQGGSLPGGPGGLHAISRAPPQDAKWGCFVAQQVEGISVGVAYNEDGKAGLQVTSEDAVAVLSPPTGEQNESPRFASSRSESESESGASAAQSSLRGLAAMTGSATGGDGDASSESIVDAMPLPEFSSGAPAEHTMVEALAARRHLTKGTGFQTTPASQGQEGVDGEASLLQSGAAQLRNVPAWDAASHDL